MDAEFIEKLLSYETSAEEREVLCEVAYGMPFGECLGEIRRDDFVNGLNSGRYKILRIGRIGEKLEYVEINFVSTTYGVFGPRAVFLYESSEPEVYTDYFALGGFQFQQPAPRFGPVEYGVKFHETEINGEMADALCRWSKEYGLSWGHILGKQQKRDQRNDGKKKKENGRRTVA